MRTSGTMRKFFIIVCASVVTMAGMAQSQKISASLDLQIRQVTASAPHRVASKTEPFLSVFVHTTQPEQVAAAIKADGYYANVLGDELLTTQVPVSYIGTLEANELVTCLEGVDKQQPNNDLARVDAGASKIHDGIELETPFTGKGVLVGIIDEGLKWDCWRQQPQYQRGGRDAHHGGQLRDTQRLSSFSYARHSRGLFQKIFSRLSEL